MFYKDWQEFQNWYCNKFQRANPLPWQDGMQALLWFVKEGLPQNTQLKLIAGGGIETGVDVVGSGTPESPYIWTLKLNTTPISEAAALQAQVTAQKLYELTEVSNESFGYVWAFPTGDGKIKYFLNAKTAFDIENSIKTNQLLAAIVPLIEGSDSVVVDLNENSTALEVHIDAEIMAKINRALLAPTSAPSELSLVGVDTNNAEVLIPKSQVGGGGDIYKHTIKMSATQGSEDVVIQVYLPISTPINTFEAANAIVSKLAGFCRIIPAPDSSPGGNESYTAGTFMGFPFGLTIPVAVEVFQWNWGTAMIMCNYISDSVVKM